MDIVPPFGLKVSPPEARRIVGKAPPLPKKSLQRLRFWGSIGTVQEL